MKMRFFFVCGLWVCMFACANAQEVLTSFSGPGWNSTATLPAGWTPSNMGADYTGSYDAEGGTPGGFRDTGASLTIQFSGTPTALIYWLRHNRASNTAWEDTSNVFDVQESADGAQWATVVRYDDTNPMGNTAGTMPVVTNVLDPASRYVRFVYVNKTASIGGNVGIDGVIVEGSESFDVFLSPDQAFVVDQGRPVSITATPYNATGEVVYAWSCVPVLPKLSEEGGTVVWDTSTASGSYTVTCVAEDEIASKSRSVSFSINMPAILPTFFSGSGWATDLPVGWEQANMGADYGSNYDSTDGNAGRFDLEGSSLTVFFAGEPVTLSYTLRHNTMATNAVWMDTGNVFDVLESADGVQWTTVARYNATNIIGTSAATGPAVTNDLDPASRYVRFVYTTKASGGGNVGIDGVRVAKPLFVIALDPAADRVVEAGETVQLTAIPTNAAATVNYVWSNHLGEVIGSGEMLSWDTTGHTAGVYTVTCTAYDGEIYATASVQITLRVPALLPTSFSGSGWASNLPVGWEQSGMGTDYNVNFDNTDGNAGQLDTTGDTLEIFFSGMPTTMSYYLRHAPASGMAWTNTANVFEVQESADGVVWSVLQRFDSSNSLSSATLGAKYSAVPAADSRFIRFVYVNKGSGNVGIDGVVLNGFQGFGVRLDPALDADVNQGETLTVEATPFFAEGEVSYAWSSAPVLDEWRVEDNRVEMDLETPGTFIITCVADDGSTTMTNQVTFTVIAPPAPELPLEPAELPTFFSGSGWQRVDLQLTGWTQSGMGSDYMQTATESGNYDKSNGYAGSFRASGATLTVYYDRPATKMTYFLQHNHGGSAWAKTTNVFNILESADGTNWTVLRQFDSGAPIPGRAAQFISVPQTDTRYIRLEYHTKSFHGGNVGIDGLLITDEVDPEPVDPLVITLIPSNTFILAYGATTTITASVTGGTAPYTYFWETDLGGDAIQNADLESNELFFTAADPLGGSFYALLTATDAGGISEVKEILFTTLAENEEPPEPLTGEVWITSFQYDGQSGLADLTVLVEFPFDQLILHAATAQPQNDAWPLQPVKTNTYTPSYTQTNSPIPLQYTPDPAEDLHIIGVTARPANP